MWKTGKCREPTKEMEQEQGVADSTNSTNDKLRDGSAVRST